MSFRHETEIPLRELVEQSDERKSRVGDESDIAYVDPATLTVTQRLIYNQWEMYAKNLLLRLEDKEANLFPVSADIHVDGEGGTDKSHLIRVLDYLLSQLFEVRFFFRFLF